MILNEIKYLLENEKFYNITNFFIINKLIQSNTYSIQNKGNLINNKMSYH